MAWLFLVSGLLDVVGKSYVAFVLRPPTDKIIKELIVRGKTTRREGYTSFGICDKMRCYYNADGKCSIFRLDDVDRCTKP